MAPSQPIAGDEIQAGGREKTEAKAYKNDIEHVPILTLRARGHAASLPACLARLTAIRKARRY